MLISGARLAYCFRRCSIELSRLRKQLVRQFTFFIEYDTLSEVAGALGLGLGA